MNLEEIIKELNIIIKEQPVSKVGCIAGLSKNLLRHQDSIIESLKCCGNCIYISVHMEHILSNECEIIADFWCNKEYNGSDFRVKGCDNWEIKK